MIRRVTYIHTHTHTHTQLNHRCHIIYKLIQRRITEINFEGPKHRCTHWPFRVMADIAVITPVAVAYKRQPAHIFSCAVLYVRIWGVKCSHNR
jgi:hypothetical protein